MIVSIGVDVVEIRRIEESLERKGDRLARRILGEAEWKEWLGRRDRAAYLAGRFAAKEAVAKAMGTGLGKAGFRDIEVLSSGGAPRLRLTGFAARSSEALGIDRWHLSISHGRDVAVAMAVAERDEKPPARHPRT